LKSDRQVRNPEVGLNTIFETALTELLKDYDLQAFRVPVSAKVYKDYYQVVKVRYVEIMVVA
jgi:hypothetical protein